MNEGINDVTEDRKRFGAHVYTDLADAIDVMRERRSRRRLKSLEHDLNVQIPDCLRGQAPIGVLFRQIGSPNYELRRTVRRAEMLGLKLVIWELQGDKFLTRSRSKYALGRMGLYSGLGRQGGRKVEYVKVIDLDTEDGKPLRDVRTTWGRGFIPFHHELLFGEIPALNVSQLFDATAWFESNGGTGPDQYRNFLALFLQHAILFETFILQGDELRTTREIVLPAFDALMTQMGMKPIIVPIEPIEWEGDPFWGWYPAHVRTLLGPPAAKRMRPGSVLLEHSGGSARSDIGGDASPAAVEPHNVVASSDTDSDGSAGDRDPVADDALS